MIEIIEVQNPFEPERYKKRKAYYTGGNVTAYVPTRGYDVSINGGIVKEPETTIPVDGDQLVVIPHIGGKGIGRALGVIAMIGLSVYAGGIAGGSVKLFGTALHAYSAGAILASGAVMFLGGKLINAIFPMQASTNYNEQQTSQSYGWDLPTPSTIAGNIVGETYGECIPQAQLLEQHVETINDEQYLNLLYCGGYGPVDSIDDIRIDYTDINNFSGLQLETRLGTNDQKPISFFKNTPLDQSVGLELDKNTPLVRTTDSTKASSLEITMEWPGGLYRVNDKGNYERATVKFRAEYRKHGATAWTNFNSDGSDYSVSEGTNSAVRRTFLVSGLEAAQYDVRVTLVDKPSSSRYQAMTQWSILTSYIDGIYSRPNKVLVAMRIKASNQLSSGVPSVNWRQKRKTVWVHNPDANAYEEKAADNPIWACYDILHGCRRLKNINTGNYEYVVNGYPAACLDAYYDQWSAAAAYADEEITNQDGEKEPRFRFDAFYDTEQRRWNAAQKAANIGHAVIIPHGRNIGIVVDRPGKVTQLFGEGRTVVSSVKGSFSSKEDRAKAVEVTYSDGNNDFKNTVLTVRSPNYNTDSSSDNTSQLTLFGVKRRSQAYREAVTALETNDREIQTVELDADIDAIVAEYGDIVGLNHSVIRVGIASGRIVSAISTTVKLDRAVTLEAGKSYEIQFMLSNDSLVKREVVAKDATTDTLTLTQAFDAGQIPQQYDNYFFGESGKSTKPFRVVGAKRDGDLKVTLSLMEYDEAVYSSELDYSKYPAIDYTNTPTIEQVKTVTATEQTYINGNAAISDIAVEWTLDGKGQTPDSYTVEITSKTSSYHERLSTRLTNCLFHNVRAGEEYEITVHPVLDSVTVGGASTTIVVQGKAVPDKEQNISNLVVSLTAGGFNLFWTPGNLAGVTGYTVYKGANGAAIGKCTAISSNQKKTTCFAAAKAGGMYQFYVVSVDKDGKQVGDVLSGTGTITLPGKLKNAAASTLYRHYSDGSTGYDINLTYGLPDVAETAAVWYKTDHIETMSLASIPEGTPLDEVGFSTAWRYAGEGASKATIPAAQLGDTYKVRLLAKDANGFVSADADAVYLTVKVEAKTEIPNTPQNFKHNFSISGGFSFSWSDVTNTDVDFYELRYDQNCGAAANLLGRAQGASITLPKLSKRKATVYVYAHNTTGKYSQPASLSYSYEMLAAPWALTFTEAPRSVIIDVPALIDGADGIRLYIADTPVDLGKNTRYTYAAEPGIYEVKACYYDVFGEGNMSQSYSFTIKPTFNDEWIKDGSLSIKKMDAVINDAVKDAQEAIPRLDSLDKSVSSLQKTDDEIKATVQSNKSETDTAISKVNQRADSISSTVQTQKADTDKQISGLSSKITQNANSVTSIVTNLGDSTKAQKAYSAIAQMQDGIESKVSATDYNGATIVSRINQSASGVTIDGKYLHVTGATQFDDNVIVNKMLAANSITADKLSASTISLTSSQGFKGGAVTLNASGMKCTLSNGSYVSYSSDGVSYHTASGNTFNAVTPIMYVEGNDGQYCKFNGSWGQPPLVVPTEHSMTRDDDASVFISSGGFTRHVLPTNVTANGFNIWASDRYKSGETVGAEFYIAKESYNITRVIGDEDNVRTRDIAYSKSTSSKYLSVSWTNSYSGGRTESYTITGSYALTTPAASKGVSVTLTYSGDKMIRYNSTAQASIDVELLLNNTSEAKLTSSSKDDTKKTVQLDVSKGDVITVKFTCHNQYTTTTYVSGTVSTLAYAGLKVEINGIKLSSDLVLASGHASFLVFDKANKQYTLT